MELLILIQKFLGTHITILSLRTEIIYCTFGEKMSFPTLYGVIKTRKYKENMTQHRKRTTSSWKVEEKVKTRHKTKNPKP